MEDTMQPRARRDVEVLAESKRCNPVLARAVSYAFYDNILHPHPALSRLRRGIIEQPTGPLAPFVIINVRSSCSLAPSPDPPSTMNSTEAKILVKWAYRVHLLETWLVDYRTQSLSDFYALTPFNWQVAAIKRYTRLKYPILLEEMDASSIGLDQVGRSDVGDRYTPLTAGTFTTCQGLERGYSLVSLTRSSIFNDLPGRTDPGIVNEKGVCTALTRGMRGAVLIGDVGFYTAASGGAEGYMGKLSRCAQATHSYFELQDPEQVDNIFNDVHLSLGLPLPAFI